MNETGFCTYFLYGLEIKVRWEGKGIEDEIDQLFKPFPFTQVCDAKTPVQLDLQFTTIENPANVPDSASEHVFCYGVSIFSSGDNIYITDGLSMFHLNPCEGTGTVALHHSFKKKTLIEKYNLFLIGLIHLLYPLGFYDLHAAALIRDGLGYLLIGDSLSGKSTATLSLVHQDWRYISDDAILLKPTPDGVSVLNFRKKFLIDPQLVYHYPKLAPFLEKSTNNDGSKRFLDVDSAYPGQFCPKGIPKILIFTSIV
ncbi:MAG: hypothetical protein GY941_15360, partial [Planctomycetes bacterium]|nr:hypothetical protein [Planctomycetota bacterium]